MSRAGKRNPYWLVCITSRGEGRSIPETDTAYDRHIDVLTADSLDGIAGTMSKMLIPLTIMPVVLVSVSIITNYDAGPK